MSLNDTTVVILAAGLGTRMRSKRAKVLHRAGGLALVEHVVGAATAVAPADRMIVVTGIRPKKWKRCCNRAASASFARSAKRERGTPWLRVANACKIGMGW